MARNHGCCPNCDLVMKELAPLPPPYAAIRAVQRKVPLSGGWIWSERG